MRSGERQHLRVKLKAASPRRTTSVKKPETVIVGAAGTMIRFSAANNAVPKKTTTRIRLGPA